MLFPSVQRIRFQPALWRSTPSQISADIKSLKESYKQTKITFMVFGHLINTKDIASISLELVHAYTGRKVGLENGL